MTHKTKLGERQVGGPMGRRKIPVDVERVVQLYRQGYSTRDIAGVVGVSHDTVLRRLKEEGQQVRGWRLPGEE